MYIEKDRVRDDWKKIGRKRASLHNADFIAELGLHLNDTVSVEKGGEIIPKIIGCFTIGYLPVAVVFNFLIILAE